jgi:hypothetical protein
MNFAELLAAHRKVIGKKWMDRILSGFPAQSVKFIRSEKDRFRNPVGSTLHSGTAAVLDTLEAGGDRAKLVNAVEGMIRLRAVQDASPSEAVRFLLDLRGVVRKALGRRADAGDLAAFDDTIETLVLDAFDLYMDCREKVFEIRIRELRNRTFKLLEREGEVPTDRGENR